MGKRHPQTNRRGPGRTHSVMLWSSSPLDQERLGLLLKLLCCQLLLKPPSLWCFGLKPERIYFHSVLKENKPEPECMASVCVRWRVAVCCRCGYHKEILVRSRMRAIWIRGERLDRGKHLDQGASIWIRGQASGSGGKCLDQGQAYESWGKCLDKGQTTG